MANTTLGIKIDSSQAKSGAAEVRAELAQIKALFADVVSLSQSVGVSLGRNMDAAASATTTATAAIEKATKASKGHKDALESEADQMSRLRSMVSASVAEYDAVNGATARAEMAAKKYATAQGTVTSSVGAGRGTFSSLTEAIDAYSAGASRAGTNSTKAGASVSGALPHWHNMRYAVQQTGYQVADFAIVMGGGNASVGQAAIQIGQLAGAFGAYGAAIGAGITVGGVLIDSLLRIGDGAKKAAAEVREYNAALNAGQAVIDRYAKALDKINGRPENWKADLYGIKDMEAALDGLIVKRQQMQKDSGFFRTSNPLGLSYSVDDFKAIDMQIQQTRYELQLARQAAQQTPAVTIGAAVRPGSTDLNELKRQQEQIQTAVNAAASANNGRGDEAKLMSLTETYEALAHAVATYATESEKAGLRAQATAKAASMGETEGKKYLATRNAEIDLMGRAVVAGERENTMRAASVGVAADQAKAYSDAQKQIALAAVSSNANLATAGIDAEKQRISQRRALLEVSAADEISLQREQDDKKRAADLEAAQQRLAVLRRTHPEEYAQIDAAERAITELRAKQANERQKQLDQEVAARAAAARQMAQIQADAVAQEQTAALAVKSENLSFGVSMGTISAAEAIAQEKAIADERYKNEVDLLNKKLALGGIEESERARVLNQIKALEQQHSLEIQKIDDKATLQRKANIQEWVQPWKAGIQSIVSAWVSGNQTMASAAKSAAGAVASNYIGKVATAGVDRVATSAVTAVAGKEAASALGLGDAGQTAAVTANTTALNALTLALGGNTTATAADATAAATNATSTAANTGVVGASSVATAANTTATVASAGTQVATLVTNTAGDGVNTAATAANTAALAANTSSQGGSAAGSLFSFMFAAGGVGEVPADGTPAILHKQEMVLPAKFAVPLRDMLTGGGKFMAAADATTSGAMRAMDQISIPAGFTRQSAISSQVVTNNTTGGGVVHNHYSQTNNVNAVDGHSVQRFFETNSKYVAKAWRKEVRGFNQDTRR